MDFAGLFNAFNIDSSDSPRVLLVISAVGGVLTIAVVALAFVGSGLALAGSTAALAGLVTAMPLWIPGRHPDRRRLLLGPANVNEHERKGNLLRTTGVDTRTPRRGEI